MTKIDTWSWYDHGNSILLENNVKLKKEEFCFNLEKESISLLTCNNYLNNKNEEQHQPSSVGLIDDCDVNTCLTKCIVIDKQHLNLSEVSLQKKYIYVNDTFLRNNRNFIAQLKGNTKINQKGVHILKNNKNNYCKLALLDGFYKYIFMFFFFRKIIV